MVSIHKGLSLLENRFIGTQWFSEQGFMKKTSGIMLRLAKYTLLDLPIDNFTLVLSHDYFGHGARYREADVGNVVYSFDKPLPYGKGGGHASVYFQGDQISDHELLNMYSAGLEVQSLINRKLSLRWMGKKEIFYREASLYFWSWFMKMSYIQGSSNILDVDETGDPALYIRLINNHAGILETDNFIFTIKDLKSYTRISLADPFLWI